MNGSHWLCYHVPNGQALSGVTPLPRKYSRAAKGNSSGMPEPKKFYTGVAPRSHLILYLELHQVLHYKWYHYATFAIFII